MSTKMNEGAALYYGTIGETLEFMADGQKKHDCLLSPAFMLDEWKKKSEFVSDEFDSVVDKHDVYLMKFSENGHEYAVAYVRMAHPNPQIGDDAAFINQIIKDGEELSHSRLSIKEYEHILFDLAEVEG
ncbi:hypothetical protein J6X15_01030 [Candidatus Saccharibacteria bacterium]|nr:hypothetical protein [Candidatus Saccharibacteria bacterium]